MSDDLLPYIRDRLSMSDDDAERLEQALAADPDLRRRLADDLRVDHLLARTLGGDRDFIARVREATRGGAIALPSRARARRRPTRSRPARRTLVAAAIAATLVVGALLAALARQGDAIPDARWLGQGDATLTRGAISTPLADGTALVAGDRIVVGATGGAIRLADGSDFALAAASSLAWLPKVRTARLRLEHGELGARVSKQPTGRSVIIDAPTASARVVGTAFTIRSDAAGSELRVVEGEVRFTRLADGRELAVRGGQRAEVAAGKPFTVVPIAGGTVGSVGAQSGAQSGAIVRHVAAGAATGGDGSPDKPFARIQDAVEAAKPGTTILIHDGTYRGPVVISRGGEPGRPIVLRAQNRGKAVIEADGNALLLRASAVEIDGLVFDGAYGADDVVRMVEAEDVTLRGCEVRRGARDGIDIEGCRGVLVDGCEVHHLVWWGPGVDHCAHGIAADEVRGLTVRGTRIHHVFSAGITLSRDWDEATIDGCEITAGAMDEPAPAPIGTVLGSVGIQAEHVAPVARGRLVVHGCRIHGYLGLREQVVCGSGIHLRGSVEARIEGNRIDGNAAGIRASDARDPTTGEPSGPVRIVAMTNVFSGHRWALRCEERVEMLHARFNTFGLGNGECFAELAGQVSDVAFVGNLFVGVAKPRAASDPSNVTCDPEAVVDPASGNYHLVAGSPAVGAAASVPDAGPDADGRVRDAAPDAGAYELR